MMVKRYPREEVGVKVPHHPGKTVTDQGGVLLLNFRILLDRAGEVQADPGPHGGENSHDFCEVTPTGVPGLIVLRILKGLCCAIEYTGAAGVHVGSGAYLNSLELSCASHSNNANGKAILPDLGHFLHSNLARLPGCLGLCHTGAAPPP